MLGLARAGHEVVGWDPSEALLADARRAIDAQPGDVRSRIRLHQGDLHAVRAAGEEFDAVCCHGVVMYVPSLADAVAALASVVRPGGLLSLLTRNRAGIAMRAGMSGDWVAAIQGFDARSYVNRLGIPDVRADDPEDVATALDAVGLRTVAWYGVRLFTDHWDDVAPPDDLDEIVAAEAEAGRRDPFRQLAALTHTIGRRPLPQARDSEGPRRRRSPPG